MNNESIKHLIYRLKVSLGLIEPDPPDQIEELKKDPQKPPEYLDRFSLNPLCAPELVGGREKDLESLKRAYNNWQQIHRPLLLIGEPGCGMTSFIHAATTCFEDPPRILPDDYRIHERKELLADLARALEVNEADSVEALAKQLPADESRVVVFENVERIFLRKLGGFDLLEDLQTLISLSSDRVFWILTINRYPLYYLDRISGIRSFFDNTFRYHLSPADDDYIEATIEARNAGFHPIFLKTAPIPRSLERALSSADAEKKQSLLRTYFFKQLLAFAAGNLSRAQFFWLESIQGLRGDKVYLKPFSPDRLTTPRTPVDVSGVSIDQHGLFTLEAIFQHGSLSTRDLDVVLRNSTQRSRITIAKLLKDSWIHPRRLRKGQQEYQVNLLYQNELKKLLIDRFNRKIKTV